MTDFGETIAQLEAIIDDRAKAADISASYVAKLLAGGRLKIAQKVGEEAIETALAAVAQSKSEVAEEAADLLFHLFVLLKATGLTSQDVASVLARRHGTSGLEEKAARASS